MSIFKHSESGYQTKLQFLLLPALFTPGISFIIITVKIPSSIAISRLSFQLNLPSPCTQKQITSASNGECEGIPRAVAIPRWSFYLLLVVSSTRDSELERTLLCPNFIPSCCLLLCVSLLTKFYQHDAYMSVSLMSCMFAHVSKPAATSRSR